jgi:hypothetical protein
VAFAFRDKRKTIGSRFGDEQEIPNQKSRKNGRLVDGMTDAHLTFNGREVKKMMFTSTSIIAIATIITAVLMIANWFIWGLNNPRDLRNPSHVTPLSGKEILELGLRRVIAANHAVLPRQVLSAETPSSHGRDDGDTGFKHVA